MMKNPFRTGLLFFVPVLLFLHCLSASAYEFTDLNDYQVWAAYEGYPRGILIPYGISGINQDYFHSLPGTPEYTSGNIVIGDSRSVQLGIFEQRTGTADFAVFAVWGGHYVPGTGTPIFSDEMAADLEACFREQIRTRGTCTVFFFATVNDYDPSGYANAAYLSAAVTMAERVASMTYEYDGAVHHPQVIVLGTEGAAAAFGVPGFNGSLDAYNEALRQAVNNSALLHDFTAIPEITGGTTFISDGLHYSDITLKLISKWLAASGN